MGIAELPTRFNRLGPGVGAGGDTTTLARRTSHIQTAGGSAKGVLARSPSQVQLPLALQEALTTSLVRDCRADEPEKCSIDSRVVWKRFDHRDLEPLKWAIIRRRRILAMQLRP